MKRSLVCVLFAGALSACAAKATPAPTSTAQGTLAVTTFPARPTSVVATRASGGDLRVTPDASGAFTLTLPKNETYAMSIDLGDRRIPFGMPRTGGTIERAFHVGSDGVVMNFGSVRYRAANTGEPLETADPAETACSDGSKGAGDGECENGVDTTTHAACTDPVESEGTVDPGAEMAVPETSAPREASGCDDHADGETNDD